MHYGDMDSWQRVCSMRLMANGLGKPILIYGLHTRGPIWILASTTDVLGWPIPLASLFEKTHPFRTRSPQSEMKVLIVTAWFPLKRTFASRNCFWTLFERSSGANYLVIQCCQIFLSNINVLSIVCETHVKHQRGILARRTASFLLLPPWAGSVPSSAM